MRPLFRRLAMGATVTVFAFMALPFVLVASNKLGKGLTVDGPTLTFHRSDFVASSAPIETWVAADGETLGFRRYTSSDPNAPLIIALHGSSLHGGQLDHLATRLSSEGVASVIAPDLRGHGPTPSRRGDIDYIGQLEDDLAQLISVSAREDQDVVLLGHSSGGGLAVRFLGGSHGALVDGAILIAPYLGHDAPTTRPNSGGWAHVLLARYIGLEILNGFGFTALNDVPVVQFALPQNGIDEAERAQLTHIYSYRLNTSYAPRPDLPSELASLPPFLLLAGSNDEAFFADRYESVMAEHNAHGDYVILPGVGHMDAVDAEATFAHPTTWLASAAE